MNFRTIYTMFIWCAMIAFAKAQNMNDLLSRYNDQSVPYISAQELRMDYNDYTVLDTREKKEYKVSHLPGAIWVGPDYDPDNLKDHHWNKNRKIVVYCSVGVRSEDYGEAMISDGYRHVKNLHGSIFSWKDAGYPVINMEGNPTEKVHIYSKKWGKYLKSGKKVY